jgi:hypothetical protein
LLLAWSFTHTGEPGPKATPQPWERSGSNCGFTDWGTVKVLSSPEATVLLGRVSTTPAAVFDTSATLVKAEAAGGGGGAGMGAGVDDGELLDPPPPQADNASAPAPAVNQAR